MNLVLIILCVVFASAAFFALFGQKPRTKHIAITVLFLTYAASFFMSGIFIRIVISQDDAMLYKQGVSALANMLRPYAWLQMALCTAIYVVALFKLKGNHSE